MTHGLLQESQIASIEYPSLIRHGQYKPSEKKKKQSAPVPCIKTLSKPSKN